MQQQVLRHSCLVHASLPKHSSSCFAQSHHSVQTAHSAVATPSSLSLLLHTAAPRVGPMNFGVYGKTGQQAATKLATKVCHGTHLQARAESLLSSRYYRRTLECVISSQPAHARGD